GGDGAAVGDDEVVAAQHLQADGNATRASVGVDVAAVVHLGREVTGHEDSVGQVAVRVGVNVASVAEGSVAIDAVRNRTHRLAGIGGGIDAAAGRVVHCGVEAEGVGAEGTARDRFRQDVAGVVDAGFAHIGASHDSEGHAIVGDGLDAAARGVAPRGRLGAGDRDRAGTVGADGHGEDVAGIVQRRAVVALGDSAVGIGGGRGGIDGAAVAQLAVVVTDGDCTDTAVVRAIGRNGAAVVDRAGAATAERYRTERGVSAGNGHDIAGVHHRRVAVVAVGIKAPGHVVLEIGRASWR